MPRHPIGETPMTNAEHQARDRAARAGGMPPVRTRRAVDQRSRGSALARCHHTLTTSQAEYAAWLEGLAGQPA